MAEQRTIDRKNAAQRLVAELREHTNKPQAPLLWKDAADAIEVLEQRLRCFAMIYLKLKHPEAKTFRIDNEKGGHWTVSTGPFASAFDVIYGSRGLTTDDASEIEEAAASAVWNEAVEACMTRLKDQASHYDSDDSDVDDRIMAAVIRGCAEVLHSLKRSPSPTEETDV